jgi:hypothetical protein
MSKNNVKYILQLIFEAFRLSYYENVAAPFSLSNNYNNTQTNYFHLVKPPDYFYGPVYPLVPTEVALSTLEMFYVNEPQLRVYSTSYPSKFVAAINSIQSALQHIKISTIPTQKKQEILELAYNTITLSRSSIQNFNAIVNQIFRVGLPPDINRYITKFNEINTLTRDTVKRLELEITTPVNDILTIEKSEKAQVQKSELKFKKKSPSSKKKVTWG